jgi:gentisate 1,2-dioxygenase
VPLARGDVVAVPSWCPVRWRAGAAGLDLFLFGDAPVYEALGLARTDTVEGDDP